MQCILIGVASPSSNSDEKLWKLITQNVPCVNDSAVTWINSSSATDADEQGQRTLLLCAITDQFASDLVSAASELLGTAADHVSCELWASAPAILPLRPLDGYDKYIKYNNHNNNSENATDHDESATLTMREYGIFFQNALVNKNEVDGLRDEIMKEIELTEHLLRVHHPEINIGKDFFSFKQIASRGNERFDLLLKSSSSRARKIVETSVVDRISPVLESILGCCGDEFDFDISVVYSKTNAPDQGWHADGDHQKGASDAGWTIDGWRHHLADPYAVCIFIPLIDLDDDTGYTQFWPGSHRSRGLAGFGPAAEITESTWEGKSKAGDAIWYDYRLMHRGLRNSSTLLRPVLQILFKRKWYSEKRNYGAVGITEEKQGIMPGCTRNATGAA